MFITEDKTSRVVSMNQWFWANITSSTPKLNPEVSSPFFAMRASVSRSTANNTLPMDKGSKLQINHKPIWPSTGLKVLDLTSTFANDQSAGFLDRTNC